MIGQSRVFTMSMVAPPFVRTQNGGAFEADVTSYSSGFPYHMAMKASSLSPPHSSVRELHLRLIELLNDDGVVRKLKAALFPQEIADKLDRQSAQIEQLVTQLKAKDARIAVLEEKVKELEVHADNNEQYTRRTNLLFSGIPEAGPEGEATD